LSCLAILGWIAQAIERLKTFGGHVRSIPETIAKLFSLGNPKIAKALGLLAPDE
jgi:hypothetical protein